MATPVTTIIGWFKSKNKPTSAQFRASWNSFRHKEEKIPVVEIEGIDDLIADKADSDRLETYIEDNDNVVSEYIDAQNEVNNNKLNKGAFEGDAQSLVESIPNNTSKITNNGEGTTYDDGTGTQVPDVFVKRSEVVESKEELLVTETNFYDLALSNKQNTGLVYYRALDASIVNLDPYLSDVNIALEVCYPLSGNIWGYVNFLKGLDDYLILGNVGYVEFKNDLHIESLSDADVTQATIVGSSSNRYTTTVGDEISTNFVGDGISFNYYSDSRGGLWEFVLDGDTVNPIQVSTYSDTIQSENRTVLFQDLTLGSHSLVGKFLGADPNNAPTSTARGWIKFQNAQTSPTFYFYNGYSFQKKSAITDVLLINSNKEMAHRVKRAGFTGATEWIPEHSNVATTSGQVDFVIDGIINNSISDRFEDAGIVEVSQVLKGFNTNESEAVLMDILVNTKINSSGISLINEISLLEDVYFEAGYVNMIPVRVNSFGTRIVDGLGNNYSLGLSDGSITPFPYRDRLNSIAVIDDDKNIFIGVEFTDTNNSFLKNKTKYRTFSNGQISRFWLQHRDTLVNKLYPQTYIDETLNAGFKHRSSMKISLGAITNISEFYKKEFKQSVVV